MSIKQEQENSRDTFFVQSVDRSLRLVDTISKDGNRGMTLLELSSSVNLPTSTVYRLLQNLLNWNYLTLSENGKYYLGLVFLTLGKQVGDSLDLIKIAGPYLDELNEKCGETIFLAIFDVKEKNSLYVGKRFGSGNIQLVSSVGAHNGVYCSANGKALLFSKTDDEIRDILSSVEIIQKTRNTITDIDKIIEDISKGRKKGYAVDMEESEYDVACVAAPIYKGDGKVAAAVSISGLVSNIIPPYRFDELKEMLLKTAGLISMELGYSR